MVSHSPGVKKGAVDSDGTGLPLAVKLLAFATAFADAAEQTASSWWPIMLRIISVSKTVLPTPARNAK